MSINFLQTAMRAIFHLLPFVAIKNVQVIINHSRSISAKGTKEFCQNTQIDGLIF